MMFQNRNIPLLCCFIMCLLIHYKGSAFQLPDSVANYYTLRNKAEKTILAGDFKTAVDLYKSAFEYKYPNERDAYNAFRSALLAGDSISARQFFNIITVNGQAREKLENTPFIKGIKNTPLYQYASKDYDSLYPKQLSGQKALIIGLLDSIYVIDQKIRTQNPLDGEEREKSVKSTDSTAAALLIHLIKQYGFPSYKRVGIFEKIKYGFEGGQSTLDLIFWHMWRTGGTSPELNELIAQAVIEGDLPPEDYAFLIDGQHKEKVYYSVLTRTASDDYTLEDINNISEIDKRRKEIGLYSLSELKKRLVFFRQNKERPELQFRFLPTLNYMVNFMPPEFSY